jgi:hypothetical protein
MHLKELPYWQARAFEHLGEHTKAQHLITKYMRQWDAMQYVKDNGYFGTTPFFISFVDDPTKLRNAQHKYLTALCCDFMKKGKEAKERLSESIALNNENHFALFFGKYGFLENS